MNKILFFLLTVSFCNAQTTTYNKTKAEGKYIEYQTKSGDKIKVGDTIIIGYPRGENFTFITQGNVASGAFLANNKVAITKIRTIGNAKRGYKTYLLFGGYGLSVYIDYESALETGEIKDPFYKG